MTAAAELQTEAQFQAVLYKYAKALGWEVWATRKSKGSPAGEPDLRMVRPPRFLLAELKREKNATVSPDQKRAAELLTACPGVEYYLWRPSDWPTIEEVLR